ncbi:MAG: glycosyltransferase family A protein [Thermoproteota archaeon]
MKTLPYALQGIRNLQYDKKEIKLVFVDGGSIDGSLELLENFRSQNIREYKYIQVISGSYDVTEGRNMCIREADGEFILFVDSDVVIPPDLLVEIKHLFSSDSKIAFINVPCVVEESKEGWVDKFYKSIREPMGQSCAAIRRSALEDVGPYYVGISRGENPTELMFRFKKKGYKCIVSGKRALHIKQKRRGFLSYLRTSFNSSVIFHYQEIRSGRKYLLAKYAFYTVLLVSLVLTPIYPGIFAPIFIVLLSTAVLFYVVRSRGNAYSALAIIVGMVLPIGMLLLLLRRTKARIR